MSYLVTPLGRLLMSVIFVISGAMKLLGPKGAAAMIAAHGLPAPHALAIIAGVVELAGGLCILLGFFTRAAATILFLYLIPVTAVMHNPVADPAMMVHFLKNLAIMGGLLMIASLGPGTVAVDAHAPRRLLPRIRGRAVVMR